ncbi:single-stranded DNA-binding protein (plasmid) [Enterococcus faecalis]|uniref:single-stranded DNA-binding protein n=1 Tax=Enterococcus faecalis TaxID=1351 RepID=UPI0029C99662|nr:single-stranded DNA-binding protein [Enterococcus faecalis]WPH48389.1 single-stranded DNA-binding protein [Enterococcus faecalis]
MIQLNAIGRLTKEVDLRTTSSGRSVTNFTLACKRKRPDKDGNAQTTFIQCVLWGKPAQVFTKYVQKGTLIAVTGELQTRSYDNQEGITHYVTELVIENFEFLESKETVQSREQKQQLPPAEPFYGIDEVEPPAYH